MKSVILLLCVAAVALTQLPTRRPPIRPDENPDSTCGRMNMTCPESQVCLERRVSTSARTIAECMMRIAEGGLCPRREFFERGTDDKVADRSTEDTSRESSLERVARERVEGVRDRDASLMITGTQVRPSCAEGQRCTDQDMCMPRPINSSCEMNHQTMPEVRCDDDGNFVPLQCRRISGEESASRPSALTCSCVSPTSGDVVTGSMTRVTSRADIPDCRTRSFRSCSSIMSDGRMRTVRHGKFIPSRMNGQCMNCQCNDGELQCSRVEDQTASCSRSEPQGSSNRSCIMDGQTVMHNEQREVGKCNRCGCRDGTLQCTRIPECRDERDSDSDETESDRENRMCDECMGMPASPVCAVRDGRTFPTRCHAMRCQGFTMEQVEDGPCAERDQCDRDPCGIGASCFARGGQTKMSRENSVPEDRRLCVNRTALRCRPTETTRDGMRRIVDDDDQDPLEELEGDGDGGDDTRSVCASDGNNYPSTCHMMVESRGDSIPRVRHQGPCQDTNRPVCGTDGVTYDNVETMRARGGNVRMDYMGECMHGETPMMSCMMAMSAGRCQNLTNCANSTARLSDGCCPICGSAVIMAMDQEAMNEHVRITGELNNADDFMEGLLRGGRDSDGGEMQPLINRTATDTCDIIITRPATTLGNTTEVAFIAKDMRNGTLCRDFAMRMMIDLNSNDEQPTVEASLVAAATVAAATVAPQEEIPGDGDESGALAFTATSCLVLLCAYLSSFLL